MAIKAMGNHNTMWSVESDIHIWEGMLLCSQETKSQMTRKSGNHSNLIPMITMKMYQSQGSTDSQPTSWMLQIKTNPVVDTIFQLKF